MSEKLSVIMPLYNADVYLRESLDSVRHQTFADFELICINDASTDTTEDILNEYQNNDSRIKVLVNKERSGAAYCRNIGIKAAKGEYLSFLDGDDIFDEEMLETAYQTAMKKKADIVMFDYKHVPSDMIDKKESIQHSNGFLEKYCTNTFSVLERQPFEIIIWSASPCNKIYKKSFIENNKLEFQNLPSSNDVYFVVMCLLLAQKIIVLNDNRIMLYARDHNQPARISCSRNPMCVYNAMLEVKKGLMERKVFQKCASHFYYMLYQQLMAALQRAGSEEAEKDFCEFLRTTGIKCLGIRDPQIELDTDSYIHSKFVPFMKEGIYADWYRGVNILSIYLDKQSDVLITFIAQYKKNGIQIGVWGAGINGKILIQFCNQHGLAVDLIVDADKQKQGKTFEGYCISPPEKAYGRVKVMIVTGQFMYQDVQKKVRQHDKDMKLLNISSFLNLI